MNNDEIMALLRLACKTLQTSYPTTTEARKAVWEFLEEVDKAAIKVSGKGIVKRSKSKLETISGI